MLRNRHTTMVARPVLAVADLSDAADFYEHLGMEVVGYDDGYAWVRHEGHEVLHVRTVAGHDPIANAASVFLFVDDLDGWHDRADRAGLAPTPVRTEPWGMREFTVSDPGGNELRLGCNA